MRARHLPAAVIAAVVFPVLACGGKVLPGSGSGHEPGGAPQGGGNTSSSGGGAGSGSGGGAVGGSASSGVGSTSGVTSSSGVISSSGGGFSSSGVIGGSASSGGSASGGIPGATCMSSRDCPHGEVCCAASVSSTVCTAGFCPPTQIGPVQLCVSSAECLEAGDICGPLSALPTLPIKVCNPPKNTCSTVCLGCCDVNGNCMPGLDDTACGGAGTSCIDCTAKGATCGTQTCQVVVAE